MKCTCCGNFMAKSGTDAMARQVFILSDQNFPAAVPAAGDGFKCLKIIRIEHGSIEALGIEFLRLISGWNVSPGTFVILSSLSHLADVGLAGYAEDLAQSGVRLAAALRGKIVVSHGPPIPLGGLGDRALIRAVVELYAWLSSQTELHDTMPGDAIKRGLAGFISNGFGDFQPPYTIRLRLPTSLSNQSKKVWVSGALEQLPSGIKPFGLELEGEILADMVDFFNSTHAMDLCPNFLLDRAVEKPAPATEKFHFITVGGSHAGRTAACLRNGGHTVDEIRLKGWRPTSEKIQELSDKISASKAKVPKGCTSCTVYQLFDSCYYFTRSEDGSLIPPKRDTDGTYHVVGESVLAPREMQQRTFKQLLPALQPDDSGYKILVAPLPRYLLGGCCSKPDHSTNTKGGNYKREAEAEIYNCKSNLKDMSYTSGLKNTRVVSTWHIVKNLEKTWSKDNIHLSGEGYAAVAEAVLEARSSLHARKRGGGGTSDTPDAKRPKLDRSSDSRLLNTQGGHRQTYDRRSLPGWHYDRRVGGHFSRLEPHPRYHQGGQDA